MSFADLNRVRENVFGVDTTNMPYVKKEELFNKNGADKIYHVRSMFVNPNGNSGAFGNLVIDEGILAVGKAENDTIEAIIKDEAQVKAVKEGRCGIKIEKYYSKKWNNICYSIKWVDVEVTPLPF